MAEQVQLIGLPLSTYTRTIAMALLARDIAFVHVHERPHSELVCSLHPLGRIPIFRDMAADLVVFESVAIANYINSLPGDGTKLRPDDPHAASAVDQWVSILCDYLFGPLEHGIVKPRIRKWQKANQKEDAATYDKAITEAAVCKASDVLSALEPVLQRTHRPGSAHVVSSHGLTWADLFLAPVLADVTAIPECAPLRAAAPTLFGWFDAFSNERVFCETAPGSLRCIVQQGTFPDV
eukprot:CAMPEP_0177669500 /NCGR_PEP_ID=MMETSP0447-20121125/23486_1 /TAXON_ID=0 /ORGANISM="Stygamoeba regulata, Strain BSH-02190019" /LENGTH=236 /DNA_ID=CAMNT_0019176395 /DNA_START=43 /DNA_END=753 /DNA_ORIENTATION=-